MVNETQMHIVCDCGRELKVWISKYRQMRCPTCKQMLAAEIERQAARNSKIVLEVAAVLLDERRTAKSWSGLEERLARILAQHEGASRVPA